MGAWPNPAWGRGLTLTGLGQAAVDDAADGLHALALQEGAVVALDDVHGDGAVAHLRRGERRGEVWHENYPWRFT